MFGSATHARGCGARWLSDVAEEDPKLAAEACAGVVQAVREGPGLVQDAGKRLLEVLVTESARARRYHLRSRS